MREQVLQVLRDGDTETEKVLEGAWQVKLQMLLRAEPTLAAEVQPVPEQVLTSVLNPTEQTSIGIIIMAGSFHEASAFVQIGTQTIYNRP